MNKCNQGYRDFCVYVKGLSQAVQYCYIIFEIVYIIHICDKKNHPNFAGVVIVQGKGLAFNQIFGALIYIGQFFALSIATSSLFCLLLTILK